MYIKIDAKDSLTPSIIHSLILSTLSGNAEVAYECSENEKVIESLSSSEPVLSKRIVKDYLNAHASKPLNIYVEDEGQMVQLENAILPEDVKQALLGI